MADVKWIKISTNIFNDDAFELLDAMPEADAIELIWFKLLILAGKQNNNGLFLFKDTIPYTDEMLASVFHRPLNTVRLAMKTFEELKMIQVIDEVYAIPNWDKYQSLDSYERKKERDKEYSRNRREKQRLMIEEKKSSDSRPTVERPVERLCSYSYSISNSNISNFNSLLNSNSDYNYISNNTELKEIIEYWLEYKDSKGKQKLHYAEKSLNGLMKKFIDMDLKYGTGMVKTAVEETIMNGWQGIVWEKATNTTTTKTKKSAFDILRDC